ncbi:MAG TPA: invasion associated locus B family protein [Alphaproteobacteria bacterium]|nr:invasion associated locus B family protein [Alphaproteobacteria bacterium]
MKSLFAPAATILAAALAMGALHPAMAQSKQQKQAQKATVLGSFGDWQALTYKEGKDDVCYVASLPKKSEGHQSKPGETNILVTHWPAQKNIGVISVTAGYEYKKDSDVELDIGSDKFNLFTRGKTAWARSGDDAKIVKAMKSGRDLTAHGQTTKGTKTTDIYSLNGFTKAYETASKACGVQG